MRSVIEETVGQEKRTSNPEDREVQVDIRKEGEPLSIARGDTGCLVMQGFTGTVGSVRYYAEQLAAKGLSIEAPRLAGHGTSWQDLDTTRYEEWIQDAEQAYAALAGRCARVFVSGLSMGGTLSLYLAEHHPAITGIISINAPVFMTDKRAPFVPILKHFMRSTPAISSDIMEPGIVEPAYERMSTAGVHEMIKLLAVTRKGLSKIVQPLLVLTSAHDHVVPHGCGPYIMAHVSAQEKRMLVFERSAHVVTMDYDRDAVVDAAWEFISRHSH